MNETAESIAARARSVVRTIADFKEELVAMRRKHDLSQEALAERMGVSQPAVASFERYDANPTLASIERYAVSVGARIEIRVVDDCVGPDWRTAMRSGPVEIVFARSSDTPLGTPSPWSRDLVPEHV